MGMAVMIKLTRLEKQISYSTITKLRLMTALAWPVATHGCEAWTLRKQKERHPGFREQVHQKVVENTMDEVDDYSASLQDGWNRKRAAESH